MRKIQKKNNTKNILNNRINNKPEGKSLFNLINKNKYIGKGIYVDYNRYNYPEKYNDISEYLKDSKNIPERYSNDYFLIIKIRQKMKFI